MPTYHRHVRVPVCTVSIQWNIQTNPYRTSEHRVETKPQETTNYELLGKDWATRAPVTQTLQSVRQTWLRTTATCAYPFVRFPSSATFKPTRYHPSEQRGETTSYGAGGNLKERENYELLGK